MSADKEQGETKKRSGARKRRAASTDKALREAPDDLATDQATEEQATEEQATEEQASQEQATGERRAKQAARSDDLLDRIWQRPWVLISLLVPAAIVVGFIQGPAAAILVLIAASLITVIALFWGSLRTLLGETPLSGADAFALAAPRAEEEQKQAILRTLKDLEFERSVGKISDEHYAELVTKLRAEAKRLLRTLDEGAKPRRERVEQLVYDRLVEAGLKKPMPSEPPADTEASPEVNAGAEAPVAKKKKGKKGARITAEAPPSAPPYDEEAEGAAKRVLIERIDETGEPGDEAPRKGRPNVDITWKSPGQSKTKESPASSAPTKKCAECGTKNDPDANFCKKCGSKTFEDKGGKKTKASVTPKDEDPSADSDAEAEERAAEEAAAEEEAASEAEANEEAAR